MALFANVWPATLTTGPVFARMRTNVFLEVDVMQTPTAKTLWEASLVPVGMDSGEMVSSAQTSMSATQS